MTTDNAIYLQKGTAISACKKQSPYPSYPHKKTAQKRRFSHSINSKAKSRLALHLAHEALFNHHRIMLNHRHRNIT